MKSTPGNSTGDAPFTLATGMANDVATAVSGTEITITPATATTFTSAGDTFTYTFTDVDGETSDDPLNPGNPGVEGSVNVSIPDVTPVLEDPADITLDRALSTTVAVTVTAVGNGNLSEHQPPTVSPAALGTVSNVVAERDRPVFQEIPSIRAQRIRS